MHFIFSFSQSVLYRKCPEELRTCIQHHLETLAKKELGVVSIWAVYNKKTRSEKTGYSVKKN